MCPSLDHNGADLTRSQRLLPSDETLNLIHLPFLLRLSPFYIGKSTSLGSEPMSHNYSHFQKSPMYKLEEKKIKGKAHSKP